MQKRQIEQSPASEAEALVFGDRNEAYGHPADDFGKTAALWTARARARGLLVDGASFEAEDVAWFMVDVKWSREQNRKKRDNVVDAIGYILTYFRIGSERRGEYR